jgi:hypothetical protein
VSEPGGPRLDLARAQILAHRRRAGALDRRLPAGAASLRRAAWAGFQDSMPRAALASIHARVEGATETSWEDPALVQVWGPRFSAYVIASEDRAPFTLGRLPDKPQDRQVAQDMAERLEAFLDGRRMSYADAGHAIGISPNLLRYGTTTGRILIRWEGARRPLVWTVPAPDVDPFEARLELARRHLHVLGPATAEAFSEWAGIRLPRAEAAYAALAGELVPVRTPIGDGWILASDEPSYIEPDGPPAPARLLPSGDAFWLLAGPARSLLVPDDRRRSELWTPRVWPGAVLVEGEVAGVWRRADARLTVEPWRRLSPSEVAAVESEAASLPFPGVAGRIRVAWAAAA